MRVFCRKVEAFVAEDGKQYIFDAEAKKWVTPEDKIEEDLQALREAVGESREDHEAAPEMKTKKKDPSTKQNSSGDRASENGTNPRPGNSENAFETANHGDPTATDSATTQAAADPTSGDLKKRKKKKKKSEKWQKSKNKTWVYVNGLPLDITVQEVHDHFAKCGVIQQDLVTTTPRIKLYENKQFGGLNVRSPLCSLFVIVWIVIRSHNYCVCVWL